MDSPNDAGPNRAIANGSHGHELERKRARDRKSQQAMRDRHKWALRTLTQENDVLTKAMSDKDKETAKLRARLEAAEHELEVLRGQNAALRLQLLGSDASLAEQPTTPLPPWEIPPKNVAPTCLSDQILQDFLAHGHRGKAVTASMPREQSAVFLDKPNLCSLFDKNERASDALSNIAGDIVRSYTEIETMPNQVAAFCNIVCLFKWLVDLDERSWRLLPPFLKPIPEQLTTPHAAWIDRIPWPRFRKYLIEHPAITMDDFAMVYSSSFNVDWPYEPALVVADASASPSGEGRVLHVSPIYLEHMRQIQHWTVNHVFRAKFPEMAALIDLDTSSQAWERVHSTDER